MSESIQDPRNAWPTATATLAENREWNARLAPLAPGESIRESLRAAKQHVLWLLLTAVGVAALARFGASSWPVDVEWVLVAIACTLVYATRSGWRPANALLAFSAAMQLALLLAAFALLPSWLSGSLRAIDETALHRTWAKILSLALTSVFLCAAPMILLDGRHVAAALWHCWKRTQGMRFDWIVRIFAIEFVLFLVVLPVAWLGQALAHFTPPAWQAGSLWTVGIAATVFTPLPFVMHRRLALSWEASKSAGRS